MTLNAIKQQQKGSPQAINLQPSKIEKMFITWGLNKAKHGEETVPWFTSTLTDSYNELCKAVDPKGNQNIDNVVAIIKSRIVDIDFRPLHKKNSDVTVLHKAIKNENQSAVEALLKSGINPNLRCFLRNDTKHSAKQRKSPLDEACSANHLEIVKLLLQYGAIPSLAGTNNNNPLMYSLHSKKMNQPFASKFGFFCSYVDHNQTCCCQKTLLLILTLSKKSMAAICSN